MHHMLSMCNDILDSGVFPSMWYAGIIIPLFKAGNVDDVSSAEPSN
jgi:hypothetical protein